MAQPAKGVGEQLEEAHLQSRGNQEAIKRQTNGEQLEEAHLLMGTPSACHPHALLHVQFGVRSSGREPHRVHVEAVEEAIKRQSRGNQSPSARRGRGGVACNQDAIS